jgi:hypothetical protein
MKYHRRNLTPEEWQQIADWADTVPLPEQCRRLGRSDGTIRYARKALAERGVITIDHTPKPPRYTREDDQRLEALLDRGMSYTQIARILKRRPSAIAARAYRRGLTKMGRGGTYTAAGVARLLGISCSKTVRTMIERGWLEAHNISDGSMAYWRIELEAVWAMMERPETWVAWETTQIPDKDLRAWAEELRAAGPRWITAGEACRRLHVHQAALCGYARRGLIRAVFWSRWFYDEDELATFVIPSEREPAPITCLACGRSFDGVRSMATHRMRMHREQREAA